jgi:hypothetical protein
MWSRCGKHSVSLISVTAQQVRKALINASVTQSSISPELSALHCLLPEAVRYMNLFYVGQCVGSSTLRFSRPTALMWL